MRYKYNSPPNWPTPPANWSPPNGWRPDPSWGPAPQGWQFWAPQSRMTTGAKLGIAAAVVAGTLVVGAGIGSAGGGSSTPQTLSAPSASSTSAPVTQEPEPAVTGNADDDPADNSADASYGNMPRKQEQFVAAVTAAQETDADNDLKLGKALNKRDKSICKIVGGGSVKNWTGKLIEQDANNDGKGIVSIEIADNVHISTWNNAFSDISDNTLIEPGSLFDDVLELEVGDVVRVSGTFVDGSDSCVNDSRITLSGKLDDPDFIFRFKSIKPAE